MIFVDTNYWLRYLTDPESEQGAIAKKLFLEAADGENATDLGLSSNTIVFFEIYWVLRSFYELSEAKLQATLSDLLKMAFVEWESKEVLVASVILMDQFAYDLEDSYHFCWAKKANINTLASFDRKFSQKWQKLTSNL